MKARVCKPVCGIGSVLRMQAYKMAFNSKRSARGRRLMQTKHLPTDTMGVNVLNLLEAAEMAEKVTRLIKTAEIGPQKWSEPKADQRSSSIRYTPPRTATNCLAGVIKFSASGRSVHFLQPRKTYERSLCRALWRVLACTWRHVNIA